MVIAAGALAPATSSTTNIPSTPSDLCEIKRFRYIKAGRVIHRVWKNAPSNNALAFKDKTLPGKSRFDPIYDDTGRVIPVWYGGLTPEGAILESVFHDVHIDGVQGEITSITYGARVLSDVKTLRRLRLISLNEALLTSLRIRRVDLIESTGDAAYQQTALWAKYLHDCALHADGLIWQSRVNARHDALVLFGDRVDSTHDLQEAGSHLPLDSGLGFKRIVSMARYRGIDVK